MMQNGMYPPLVDSSTRRFAGMLTVTDFIYLIQYYYTHSSYSAALIKSISFKYRSCLVGSARLHATRSDGDKDTDICNFSEVAKKVGAKPRNTNSLHPLTSLYDAAQFMLSARLRRIALVEKDDTTASDIVISVLTQYRILKFVACNVSGFIEDLELHFIGINLFAVQRQEDSAKNSGAAEYRHLSEYCNRDNGYASHRCDQHFCQSKDFIYTDP